MVAERGVGGVRRSALSAGRRVRRAAPPTEPAANHFWARTESGRGWVADVGSAAFAQYRRRTRDARATHAYRRAGELERACGRSRHRFRRGAAVFGGALASCSPNLRFSAQAARAQGCRVAAQVEFESKV